MDSKNPIEPGVIRTFRNFSAIRLVLLALTVGIMLFDQGVPRGSTILDWVITLLDIAILLAYLSWQKASQALKSFYLPLGIIWATLGPILESNLGTFLRFENFSMSGSLLNSWQLMPILFIPLVIIGWQYSAREVILFCIATAVLDALPAALRFATTQFSFFSPFPLLMVNLTRMIVFYFVGIMITNLMATQRKQKKELTQANIRLSQYANTLEELTVSRERNRLARELHDVLAHTLSSVAVELEAVKALWEKDKPKAEAMLDHSLQATREGLTETRRALVELRASPLEDLGLSLSIRNLAESFANRSGIKLDLQVDEDLPDYRPEVQQCIYRVAQEALANVSEHALASEVAVSLSRKDKLLMLQICDNGKGFDPDSLKDDHYGIRGMRERVEMIGGNFRLLSDEKTGTTIRVTCGEN